MSINADHRFARVRCLCALPADGTQRQRFWLNDARLSTQSTTDAVLFVNFGTLSVEAQCTGHRTAARAGTALRPQIGQTVLGVDARNSEFGRGFRRALRVVLIPSKRTRRARRNAWPRVAKVATVIEKIERRSACESRSEAVRQRKDDVMRAGLDACIAARAGEQKINLLQRERWTNKATRHALDIRVGFAHCSCRNLGNTAL